MDDNKQNYEQKTGNIYGKLFNDYDKKLFEDSVELFEKRQKKWGVDLNWFKGKVCLDAGCGGGRFLVAISSLGVKEIVGIDISKQAVEVSNHRLKDRGVLNARAIEASVFSIPFGDNHFDYVISSGVIHYTHDPHKAFIELARVLKPGGKIFLSIYGKGGLKWLTNDIFRYSICKIIPFKTMDLIFKFLGVPANKRYNLFGNLYAKYTKRFSESEVRQWFKDAGFENFRRVKFERYDYEKPLSRIIHGEGWMQIMADKKY
jgi:ubiquinone/menaquinone biosynthesis C-methylase UbiE